MTQSKFVNGLASIADNYDVFFLDIFGVLHDGVKLFPDTLDCLSSMKAAGKTVGLISNIALSGDTYSANGLVEKFGIIKGVHYDEIVTAGDSAIAHIRKLNPKKVWFAADKVIDDLTNEIDAEIVTDINQADLIVNAIGGLTPLTIDTLYADFQTGIDRGLEMLCANPDLVVHIGEELRTCAGTHALWYEEQGGYVSWHGKPYEPIYTELWERLGRPDKSRIAAIGDSLRTDVAGAVNFGITAVWNLAGIHREEVLDAQTKMHIDPALVDIAIRAYPAAPNFIIDGFVWQG